MSDNLRSWVEKELRKRKLSHRAFAKKMGVSHAFISSVLKGTRPVTWDFCKVVSDGFDEPIVKVLVLAGFIDSVPVEVWEDETLKGIIAKYQSLPEKGKVEFKEFLDWLSAKYEL